jgi:hypothetical protein
VSPRPQNAMRAAAVIRMIRSMFFLLWQVRTAETILVRSSIESKGQARKIPSSGPEHKRLISKDFTGEDKTGWGTIHPCPMSSLRVRLRPLKRAAGPPCNEVHPQLVSL